MNPLWLIYHIPKTGGQTIRDRLAEQLEHGVDYVHLGKWFREADLGYEDLAAMSPTEREKIRVLSGHPVSRDMAKLFPGRPIREVVIVREPADRLVSLYNFRPVMRERRGQPEIGFDEFIDATEPNPMTAFLARRFGCQTRAQQLDDVLHELTSIWLVGRTERLDDLLPLMLAGMGLSVSDRSRSNVTGVDITRRMSITHEIREQLRARHPLDVILYDVAARLEQLSVERLTAAMRGRSVQV